MFMTPSQQRRRKRTIFLISFFIVSMIYLVVASSLLYKQMHVGVAIVCVLFVAYTVFLEKMSKRLIDYEPDKISNQPLADYLDLSNSFDWKKLLFYTIWISALLAVYLFFPSKAIRSTIVVIPIIAILTYALGIYYNSRNIYRIEMDVLYIKEYSFFRSITEIRIPISEIKKICIKGTYTIAVQYPMLILTVGEVERELRCSSHIEEIAQELYSRSIGAVK